MEAWGVPAVDLGFTGLHRPHWEWNQCHVKSIIRNAKSKTNAGKTLTGSEVQKYYKQFSNTTSCSYLYQHDAWRRVWATGLHGILMPFRIQSPMRNINTNVITNANMMPGAELGAHCSAPLVEEGPHHYWGLHSCVSTDPCMAHHFDAEFLPEIFLVTIYTLILAANLFI